MILLDCLICDQTCCDDIDVLLYNPELNYLLYSGSTHHLCSKKHESLDDGCYMSDNSYIDD